MIHVNTFTVNPFQENTYLLSDDATRQAILIDPGVYSSEEKTHLLDFVRSNKLVVKEIWLTHAHIDHVLGLRWATETFMCGFFHSQEDESTLRSTPLYAGTYFGISDFALPDAPGTYIAHGDTRSLGSAEFIVLFTPGHAPGHVCFYNPAVGLIAGDVLFKGSIGRTDLPGGDFAVLEKSIQTHLYTLHDNTPVYPGHGPTTTVGYEKKHNPYVKGS
jgi:hydroxyacylglutathione hydrolase